MDYYKKYIEQLNRYAGGFGIVVCKDWGASVAPLQACLDDLQGLSDAYLDEADEEHKRAKLERRAAVGDYLTKLDVVADKDEIVRGMMAQLGEVATGARELVKSGEWTKEQYIKWHQVYNTCIMLWEQKANEIAVELGVAQTPEKKDRKAANFADIVNTTQSKEDVLRRLHKAIDGKSGAYVGRVLSRAIELGLLNDIPTQAQYVQEFKLNGSWAGIHKYAKRNYQYNCTEDEIDRISAINI